MSAPARHQRRHRRRCRPGRPAAAAWLTPMQRHLAHRIVRCHLQAFGIPLLASCPEPTGTAMAQAGEHLAQELFASHTVVLAHDGGTDPHLIYANAAALQLWQRPWAAMVGMPSRLTAEPEQQPERARMLAQARARQALSGYSGIRISADGRRFLIRNARLWTLVDESGLSCGQAAAFSDWHWL